MTREKVEMKRYGNLYEKIYSFENLHQAYLSARKGKRFRDDVLEFTYNLEENLYIIQNELIWKTYQVGRYRKFFVYKPKKRLIMAAPFKDRVVQWAVYRVLNPLFDKSYTTHSYACRKDKGAHAAADQMQSWLRLTDRKPQKWFYLKMDIAKYFYRVDHVIMQSIMGRKIKDKDVLWLLDKFLNEAGVAFGLPLGVEVDDCPVWMRLFDKGMPIGDLLSQFRANVYMNILDQYCKQDLQIKYYIRYMDDFIILHYDKKYLQTIKQEIENFLDAELKLQTNSKTCIRPTHDGVGFVGFRIFATHRKLKKKTALRMRKRLEYLQGAYMYGEIDFETVNATAQSYLGLLKHCDSYSLRKKIYGDLVFRREEGCR